MEELVYTIFLFFNCSFHWTVMFPKEMFANSHLKIKVHIIHTQSPNLQSLYWAWGSLFSAGKTPFSKRLAWTLV